MFASIGFGPAGWEDPMLPSPPGTRLRAAPSLGPRSPYGCSHSLLLGGDEWTEKGRQSAGKGD
eukprot:3284114-Pleurochrysis_carterae.AAC.1